MKLLLPATTTTTENNNNNNTNNDDDDEMLTLAFARDENYNTNCNATTRVRINGDDEEATKTVSLEKVARKRNQTTKTTTMAFAAMDEIHVVFSTARPDDENDDESLVKALRFTVTNERNERVCEGTLKPPRGDATEKDAAVSIWASEDEEDEEDNENALLTMNERRRNKEGKIRVEISFVGESATLKAACEVAAKKFAPFERRVSSREYSPTPSERGGACSDKSVSWDECNVDRGDDFSSSAVDDDGFDDELNLSSSNEKKKETVDAKQLKISSACENSFRWKFLPRYLHLATWICEKSKIRGKARSRHVGVDSSAARRTHQGMELHESETQFFRRIYLGRRGRRRRR